MVTCIARRVVRCSSDSSSGNPRNANRSPPPNATSSVPAAASPSNTRAAESTVQALWREVSREQKSQVRLQRFVMPNITTRGARRRSPTVRWLWTGKLVPVDG